MLDSLNLALRGRRKKNNRHTTHNGVAQKAILFVKDAILHQHLTERPPTASKLCKATSTQPRAPLCHLPTELLQLISALLPLRTQLSLGLTCKTLLARVDLLWPRLVQHEPEASKCATLWTLAAAFPSLVPYTGPRGSSPSRPRTGWWGVVRAAPLPRVGAAVDLAGVSRRAVRRVAAYERLAVASGVQPPMLVRGARAAIVTDECARPITTHLAFRLVREALLLRVVVRVELPPDGEGLFSRRQARCLEAACCWHDAKYEDQLIVGLLLKDVEERGDAAKVLGRPDSVRSPAYRCRYCPTEIQYSISDNVDGRGARALTLTSWRDLGSGQNGDHPAWLAVQHIGAATPAPYEPQRRQAGALNEAFESPSGAWQTRHLQLPMLQSSEARA